jgi:hypothetical protein
VQFFEIARAPEELPEAERREWLDRIDEWRRRVEQGIETPEE